MSERKPWREKAVCGRLSAVAAVCTAALLLTACSGVSEDSNPAMKGVSGGLANGYDSGYEADTVPEAEDGAESYSSREIAADGEVEGSGADGTGSAESIDRERAGKDAKTQLSQDKIVYTGNVYIETLSYGESKKALLAVIKKYEGITENENESNANEDWYTNPGNAQKHYSVTVRIPSGKYQKFMASVGDIGNVVSSSSNASNISAEYYDTQARIKSLKTELKRLRKLLEKAESLQDIIQIEDRISQVEYELDSAQTRLNGMDLDVAYSTVTIDITEVSRYTTTPETFFQKISDAFAGSGRLFIQFVQGLIIFAIYALPIVCSIGLILFVIIKIGKLLKIRIPRPGRKRAARKRKEKEQETGTAGMPAEDPGQAAKPEQTAEQNPDA